MLLVKWDIPCYLQVMAKRSIKAEQTYEASGKRPGHPVGARLSAEQLKALDAKAAAAGAKRSAFVKDAVLKAIGWNEPSSKRRLK